MGVGGGSAVGAGSTHRHHRPGRQARLALLPTVSVSAPAGEVSGGCLGGGEGGGDAGGAGRGAKRGFEAGKEGVQLAVQPVKALLRE